MLVDLASEGLDCHAVTFDVSGLAGCAAHVRGLKPFCYISGGAECPRLGSKIRLSRPTYGTYGTPLTAERVPPQNPASWPAAGGV